MPRMLDDPIVYVIDDEPEMRRSLEMLLAMDNLSCRSFASAEEFLACLPSLADGIVVSDLSMPGMSGLELLRTLSSMNRRDTVIMMSAHGDIPLAVSAIGSGAVDFIEKPFEASRFLDAVSAGIERRRSSSIGMPSLARLTRREREVLRHIVAGLTSKRIAIVLGISPRTVDTHRQHLTEKTGMASLPQLVRFGIMAGLDADVETVPSKRERLSASS